MNNFLSFKNEKKSHLFQENGGNVDLKSKVWWIATPSSTAKTKVIYIKKMEETRIEIAKRDE